MEEDIKILEMFKNRFEIVSMNCLGLTEEEVNEFEKPNYTKKVAVAIENLIKGYRELEEKLDNSRKANELLNKTNNELRLEIRTTYSKVVNDIISKFNLGDDYIPKSKVKEKIDEVIAYGLNNTVEVLQELLEKGE